MIHRTIEAKVVVEFAKRQITRGALSSWHCLYDTFQECCNFNFSQHPTSSAVLLAFSKLLRNVDSLPRHSHFNQRVTTITKDFQYDFISCEYVWCICYRPCVSMYKSFTSLVLSRDKLLVSLLRNAIHFNWQAVYNDIFFDRKNVGQNVSRFW